ncbi:MAG: DNA-processing protein DprA [Bergeyella zoohelcum]|nr:DNA-processing protein DprA [Bergeyella zoohelcum]
MFSDEHLYSIALRRCSMVGDGYFKKLIQTEGSAQNIWKTPKNQLQKLYGIGEKIVKEIGNDEHLKFAEKELIFCENNNIKVNLKHLGDLPKLLAECENAPAILYQKGNFDQSKTAISIVGTRNLTSYGKNFIGKFLAETKDYNIQTISGLALGADTEVHQQSLENNIPTTGVLAHGFHMLYPSKNKVLSEKILENGGCLFTEFNTSEKPDREHFIQRNRIVAGLSMTTIVVETAFGGGSISTVGFANSYNRDVYALPGKITDKYSQGCNLIISQNKAATIATVSSLIKDLGLEESPVKLPQLFPDDEVKIELSENQQKIYDYIKQHPQISLDDLAENLEIPVYKIHPILLEMEILGCIRSLSGRQFQVI